MPTAPPCVFPGVPKSCLKQASSHARSTSAKSEKRAQNDAELTCRIVNRIKDFKSFCKEIGDRYRHFNIIYNDGDDLYLSMTDPTGQKVIKFVHYRHLDSHFAYLHLVNVEKDGINSTKKEIFAEKKQFD